MHNGLFFAKKSLLDEKTTLTMIAHALGPNFSGNLKKLAFFEKIIFMGQKSKKPENLEK